MKRQAEKDICSHMKSKQTIVSNTENRTSLVIQWLRLCPSTAGGMGSIPGQGSSTSCVVWSKTTTTTTTKLKQNKAKQKIENRLVVARDGECGVKEMGEHSQEVQTLKEQNK